jgi:hypothetical protein
MKISRSFSWITHHLAHPKKKREKSTTSGARDPIFGNFFNVMTAKR